VLLVFRVWLSYSTRVILKIILKIITKARNQCVAGERFTEGIKVSYHDKNDSHSDDENKTEEPIIQRDIQEKKHDVSSDDIPGLLKPSMPHYEQLKNPQKK